ncbi:MAG: glutathione S-transferase N-terminal domain-containing protein [Geminicoccaceae bacterium]
MIDLYTWATPNGRKVSIMLEECGLPYAVHPVDIGKNDQFKPDFLAISPNNKIPAIVDSDNGWSVFESGAILIYLAEKTGRFLPADPRQRMQTLEWLMFQMGGLGPMLGQAHHFLRFAPEKLPYAMKRYADEAQRLYGVMDRRLAANAFLAGPDYSIADIACWPWTTRYEWQQVDLDAFPNVRRWYDAIKARPAVQRGYDVPKLGHTIPA